MSDAADLSRRGFLRAAGLGAVAIGGVPLVLSGCGDRSRTGAADRELARRSIAVSYSPLYAPAATITALAEQRAVAQGLQLTFAEQGADAAREAETLNRWSGERGGFRVVVFAPNDPAALSAPVGKAAESGIKVVSFVVPIQGAAAAVEINPRVSAELLAGDAVRWATQRGGAPVKALYVRPRADAVASPFRSRAEAIERTLLTGLSGSGSIDVVAATEAAGTADAAPAVERALAQYPEVRVVFCWNDLTALGALPAIRSRGGAGSEWYVGATTAPSVSSAEVLNRLEDRSALRCIVAARPRMLANAIVDLPAAILRGRQSTHLSVAPHLLIPGSKQVTMFERDLRRSA